VGKGLLGRVVNALGEPIDGKGPIKAETFYPVEKIAPGIITRKGVSVPGADGHFGLEMMVSTAMMSLLLARSPMINSR